MKLALIGYGKMGRMIEQIALSRGHEIVSIIDIDNIQDLDGSDFSKAEVAIEFTVPSAAFDNCRKAMLRGIKVVSGTTGWFDTHYKEVEELCKQGKTLFWSSNFSPGVAVFNAINRRLARLMNAFPQYNVSMKEVHHVHKLDAPSGTAITLANTICKELERKEGWSMGQMIHPDGTIEPASDCSKSLLPIDCERKGQVPGIHTVHYDSPADSIIITHEAHSRQGFAFGAVLAAEYTKDHQGLLSITNMFDF